MPDYTTIERGAKVRLTRACMAVDDGEAVTLRQGAMGFVVHCEGMELHQSRMVHVQIGGKVLSLPREALEEV